MNKCTLAAMLVLLCTVSACESVSSFTPYECEDLNRLILTEGIYYLCNEHHQLVPLGYHPQCEERGDIRFREENNYCYREHCNDKFVWERDKSASGNPVSCRLDENGKYAEGECLNGSVDCVNRQELWICGVGKWTYVKPEIARCRCTGDASTCTMLSDNNQSGYVCLNGLFTACEGLSSCQDKKCGGCRNGDKEYDENGKIVKYCENGSMIACTGTICDVWNNARCSNEMRRCEGDRKMQMCVDNHWVTLACAQGYICVDVEGCVLNEQGGDIDDDIDDEKGCDLEGARKCGLMSYKNIILKCEESKWIEEKNCNDEGKACFELGKDPQCL